MIPASTCILFSDLVVRHPPLALVDLQGPFGVPCDSRHISCQPTKAIAMVRSATLNTADRQKADEVSDTETWDVLLGFERGVDLGLCWGHYTPWRAQELASHRTQSLSFCQVFFIWPCAAMGHDGNHHELRSVSGSNCEKDWVART